MIEVWPALDIFSGQAVRLRQGLYDQMTIYHQDPLHLLDELPCPLPRVHLIDLQGARSGQFSEWSLLKTLSGRGLHIEVGGGFRTLEAIALGLDHGAQRIILGSQAITNEQFAVQAIRRFGPDHLVLSLDIAGEHTRIHGWQEDGPKPDLLWQQRFALGYRLLNVTDISRDGTLQGVDDAFWREWAKVPGNVGAGGGILSLADLIQLEDLGISRAVVGKAWLSGSINLKDVLGC
ncbi:MAG: 1-(5-phosphoribosyl)-5-[(5-phosphoribosylamino)methylideneamino]imidazole-4-carboxamide isomerase [Sulfobacillus sp.]